MKESYFSEKLCSFKFFCASLVFMYIKNKRLLTSLAKIRKITIYFFDFLKDIAMLYVCGNFIVYSMSLSNFRGGGGRGQNSQQYYAILKKDSANEKGKFSKPV